jgi:hypothetical protein
MSKYTKDELKEILEFHNKWLNDEEGGTRANLTRANLIRANLDGANLTRANLYGANLYGANLDGANLDGANLTRANLDGANLDGANLYGANLTRANLTRAVGNLKHIKVIQCETYYIAYTSNVLQIGCQKHTVEVWKNFDDEKISAMDNGALEWWNKWKPIIMQIIEISPAKPTEWVE